MQIILMRHGEPEIDVHLRRSGVEMQQWIQNYDLSTVRKDSKWLRITQFEYIANFIQHYRYFIQ